MSTKRTIACGDDFDLHQDLFDDGHVYLNLRGVEFEASRDEVKVRIPVHVWEYLRGFAGMDFSAAGITDLQIEQEATACVDERLAKYEVSDKDAGNIALRLGGVLTMGAVELPREQQITSYIRWLRQERDRQRDVLDRVSALQQAVMG